jgi:DNA-binding CsgD family transcriptional regulator
MQNEKQVELFTEAEVQRLVRLLAESLAPDDGRAAKIARLMKGLCDWIGGDGWFWVRSRIDPVTLHVDNHDFLYGGEVDQAQFVLWGDRGMHPVREQADELIVLRDHLLANNGKVTVTLPELVTPEVWNKPANRAFVEKMGFDQSLYSVRQLTGVDGLFVSFVMICRRTGGAPFDQHLASLVHLVMNEVGSLHAGELNLNVSDGIASLTPRQRIVLACLIDGQSVKLAAKHLNLSPHTVTDHVKEIYKAFNVNSRGELLNRFINGGRQSA